MQIEFRRKIRTMSRGIQTLFFHGKLLDPFRYGLFAWFLDGAAAVLLQATPTQMGLLTAMEIAPFVLLSLPSGVWLDRVRKLPVYVIGECLLALAVASVPLAWWFGQLLMGWMYAIGFVLGCVYTVAGSAAQIVLTQVVARERLVEAACEHDPDDPRKPSADSTLRGPADRVRHVGGAQVSSAHPPAFPFFRHFRLFRFPAPREVSRSYAAFTRCQRRSRSIA